ncbi:MAG: BrnT family toxin [Bacteroidetes bacterium]|nr:BrnT family toxin [Bacteroidota bacterium]
MLLEFDWNQWNVQKNEIKHGVSMLEAESMFFDDYLVIFENIMHSIKNEKRWICYGLSMNKRILMCAFTIRNKKVRIISCRSASKKERGIYEKSKIS